MPNPLLHLLASLALAASGTAFSQGVQRPPEPDELWTTDSIEEAAKSIQAAIEAQRGRSFRERVTVVLEPRSAIRTRVRTALSGASAAEDVLAEELSAKLLGLIPADYDLQEAVYDLIDDQSGAYIEPETTTLFLAEDYGQGAAQLMLVRALTRIFDEQHYQLSKWDEELRTNTDALLAVRAVASGSASASEAVWRARNPTQMSERERSQWPTTLDPDRLADIPPYLWKPTVAFALRGYSFLQRSSVLSMLLQEARLEDIERALGDLPVSTEQVLHPVKYWDQRREDLPRTIELDLEALPSQWELLREDTLGELFLGILVDPDAGLRPARPGSPSPYAATRYTCAASEGWDGDRFVLLRQGEGYLLHLITAWDEIGDASEFFTALDLRRPHLQDNLGGMNSDPAQYGLQLQYGERHDQVLFSTWVGLGSEEAQQVIASIHFSIAG